MVCAFDLMSRSSRVSSFQSDWTARITAGVLACVVGLGVAQPGHGQNTTPSVDTEFSFVVIGHPRGNSNNEPFVLRDALIEEVADLEPDLLVFTGDMIWGDWFEPEADRARITEHWDRFDRAWGQLGVPILRVPGNHDVNDPVTRDVFTERYGALPRAESFGNSRFLLLATPVYPEGDTPPSLPRSASRVTALDAAHVAFLEEQVAASGDHAHSFIFTHHVVWRSLDWPWWSDVEPMLAGSDIRAVFSGDYGPSKFAYREKNGIEYFQSAVSETWPPDQIYTSRGLALNLQFDNYLHVTVSGNEVDVDVRTFGATTSGRHSPDYWDTAFSPRPQSTQEKIREFVGGPKRQAFLGGLLVLGFLIGAFVTRWFGRRA